MLDEFLVFLDEHVLPEDPGGRCGCAILGLAGCFVLGLALALSRPW